ncbi:MAG: response regulator transcription factor [Campylobacterota bacterium]|nr:response regulator transcription factor [Campylobacterota bacterium]
MKLMLVEDEYLLNKAIKTYLKSKGFEVDSFLDGLEAIDAIGSGYDLFVIDIDIPQLNGIDILERIRLLYPTLPVIMISATIDMEMIAKAYTKGCSDYLKKPFDIKELELKIRAFTRLLEEKIDLGGEISYDKGVQQLNYRDEVIVLTPKEHLFVSLLIGNRGRIVPHEQIEFAVWGSDVDAAHLRQLVNRLRKKLPIDFIQNRIGEGYIIA